MPHPRHSCRCKVHMASLRQERARVARLWEERRALGLCGACGEEEAMDGKALGRECLKVRSIKQPRATKRTRRVPGRRRGAA